MTNQSCQTDNVKLREYIEALITELNRYFESRLVAIENATSLARESMTQRLDGMNEFRAALKDQTALMVTRTEMNVLLGRLQIDVDDLKRRGNIAEGKASQTSVIFFGFLSVAALIISIVKMLIG